MTTHGADLLLLILLRCEPLLLRYLALPHQVCVLLGAQDLLLGCEHAKLVEVGWPEFRLASSEITATSNPRRLRLRCANHATAVVGSTWCCA